MSQASSVTASIAIVSENTESQPPRVVCVDRIVESVRIRHPCFPNKRIHTQKLPRTRIVVSVDYASRRDGCLRAILYRLHAAVKAAVAATLDYVPGGVARTALFAGSHDDCRRPFRTDHELHYPILRRRRLRHPDDHADWSPWSTGIALRTFAYDFGTRLVCAGKAARSPFSAVEQRLYLFDPSGEVAANPGEVWRGQVIAQPGPPDSPGSFRYIEGGRNLVAWPASLDVRGDPDGRRLPGPHEDDHPVTDHLVRSVLDPWRGWMAKEARRWGSSITLPCRFLQRMPPRCRLQRPERRRRISRCQVAGSVDGPCPMAGFSRKATSGREWCRSIMISTFLLLPLPRS